MFLPEPTTSVGMAEWSKALCSVRAGVGSNPLGTKACMFNFFAFFAIFGGGVLYPPVAQIGLILRYVRELNRFYNCTKNQLGPPNLDGCILFVSVK